MITWKLEYESGLPDSESATRFAIGSTVPPFLVFLGRFSDKLYHDGTTLGTVAASYRRVP